MATLIDWPSTIPQCFEAGSLSGKPRSGTIITQMDTGPPKKRRRSTAVGKDFSGTMLMTFDEFDDLNTFYHITTGEGSERFNFPDPYNSASTFEAMFTTEPEESDAGPNRVKVSISIVRMPS